jgi:hypothetical protein
MNLCRSRKFFSHRPCLLYYCNNRASQVIQEKHLNITTLFFFAFGSIQRWIRKYHILELPCSSQHPFV